MDYGPGRGRSPPPALAALPAIVPSRAVLTELARGFLLENGRDPGRAARFAATFLNERAGPADPAPPDRPRLPSVRRLPVSGTPERWLGLR